ncbi:glucose-6-phosphate dehydrogenase [bacterium]|nr:glucose-6-phosphate dehydrogenase [bacterium]
MIIFGGTGDLTKRKLIPALSRLQAMNFLPEELHLILSGRRDFQETELINQFKEFFRNNLASDPLFSKGFGDLASRIHYVKSQSEEPDSGEALSKAISMIEGAGAAPVRLFYLAVPPDQFPPILSLLAPLLRNSKDDFCPSRVIIEKPFGWNLQSAKNLNSLLKEILAEDQILRIDHYLGKEAVQNIMVMRFANTLFEPIWNRAFIDNVQISFAEEIGIGSRAIYFDQNGILRDVVQNHLLQVLCLIAMEPPVNSSPDALKVEKFKVLQSLRKINYEKISHDTVRAQYGHSSSQNREIKAYLEEPGVAESSVTETYVALKVFIDSWRWSGVPFYLRAGKRLSTSVTEVAITFKSVPHIVFPFEAGKPRPNVLILRVQPDEGIYLTLQSKLPGMTLKLSSVDMDFSYQKSFGSYRPDAYERLLLDALHGETSLFLRNDEIEAAWEFIDPIIEAWQAEGIKTLSSYPAGSDGPEKAVKLIQETGHSWFPLKDRKK